MFEPRQLSDHVLLLLKSRGLVDEEAMRGFLEPSYERDTHDALSLAGIDAALTRIARALDNRERIAVYADFDCDGIPGAALLHDLFQKLGHSELEVYIPHRDREGYGFHTEAIDRLAERGVSLIITVDVGTTAREAVEHARSQGIDVVVTDHHEIIGDLPCAIAVLNPKLSPYPYPHLCGTGVAFKLAQALLMHERSRGSVRVEGIPEGWEKWLLDLVAIATVADMVPLTGENRALVRWGLTVLRRSPRAGIKALCTKLRLRQSELTEDDIGFSIAPRINAASRMDSPELAFTLLTTTSPDDAEHIAAELESLNASRKGVVAHMVKEARRRVHDRFDPTEKAVVLGDPSWKPSLLGLAANSIMGERGGLVCLWGKDVHGNIKGSCRSDGSLSVVELFEVAKESFSAAGGHEASGGFTVAEGKIHTLAEDIAAAAKRITAKEGSIQRLHDLEVPLSAINVALHRDLSLLSPFGVGNPKPILRISRARIVSARPFGKEKNHVEVSISCSEGRFSARAFDFFRTLDGFSAPPDPGSEATVLATIEKDSFRGGVALRIIDMLPV